MMPSFMTSPGSLRAHHSASYEGGIRTPLIIKWPGIAKPGSVIAEPVTSTAFNPTCLAAARATPGMDAGFRLN